MKNTTVIRFDSPYTFTDSIKNAERGRMTLREYIVRQEKMIEDPRVKGFMDSIVPELHNARKNESKVFKDGAEAQFAYNGFTVLDLNIRRPLFNTFAMKHVPHITGGGAVETDKGFFMNYATQHGRLASGNNNKVNLVKSNVETLEAPILPITLGLFVGQIDLMKAETIGYDVIGVEGEAVRYSYQIELDKFAFVGHRGIDGTAVDASGMARGLINLTSDDADIIDLETNTNITSTIKKMEYMPTDDLVDVFVGEYSRFAESVVFQADKLPNKWLLYPSLFAKLTKPAYLTSAGTVFKSHLEYIKAQLNEIAQAYGGPQVMFDVLPYIAPTAEFTNFDPILNEDGTNNTGRTILYRQDAQILRSRLALDLTPGAIVYDPANNGMRRNYVAFVGTPLVFYKLRYIDNGTTTV